MFLIGMVGFIVLFWLALVGLWKLIPWLVLAVIVTSILGFVLDHLVVSIILFVVILVFYFIGAKQDKQ